MQALRLVLLGLALLGAGCSSRGEDTKAAGDSKVSGVKPSGQGRAKLWLTATERPTGPALTVHYERGEAAGPRVADIRIAHSESLELVGSVAGAGTEAAGKELTIQKPQPGLIRVILLSRDASELDSGALVELDLRRTGGAAAKVDILMDKPVFAPAESMQGLMIGDPIQL